MQWLATGSVQRPTERMIETNPLSTTRKVAEELNTDHSMVIWHLKQIGKKKKLDKWVSQELTANQINNLLQVSFSLTLCNNNVNFM